jgi:hypothetical protein
MKIKFLLFIFCTFITKTQASQILPVHNEHAKDNEFRAQSFNTITDSIYRWNWDSTFSAWIYSNKTIYQNDGVGHHDSRLVQRWNNNTWENSHQEFYGYDVNYNLVSDSTRNWDGFNWISSSRWISNYDSLNHYIYDISQSWNGTAWEDDRHYSYWWNQNNLDSMYHIQWNGTAWVYPFCTKYFYDLNNVLISEKSQAFDGINWINFDSTTYSYNSHGDLTEQFSHKWDSTGWVDDYLNQYFYDSSFVPIGSYYAQWFGGTWINSGNVTYYADANNLIASSVNINSSTHDSTHYYYSFVTGIIESNNLMSFSVFPNPANEIIRISSTNNCVGNLNVIIYDLEGREVLNQFINANPTEGTNVIHIDKLNKGIYFLKIINEKKFIVKKILKS